MQTEKLTHIVYLALGTNLGDREANLRLALETFAPQIIVLHESRVYETEPWGFTNQPTFLNMVVQAETILSPDDLLQYLKQLETSLGRRPSFRNGPRLIDLDILLYDDLHLDTPGLVIPHPRLQERAFVLVPLADLAPDYVHPVLALSVRQMLGKMDVSGVRLFKG